MRSEGRRSHVRRSHVSRSLREPHDSRSLHGSHFVLLVIVISYSVYLVVLLPLVDQLIVVGEPVDNDCSTRSQRSVFLVDCTRRVRISLSVTGVEPRVFVGFFFVSLRVLICSARLKKLSVDCVYPVVRTFSDMLAAAGVLAAVLLPQRGALIALGASAVTLLRKVAVSRCPRRAKRRRSDTATPPVTLEWANVTLELDTGGSGKKKVILQNAAGKASPGRVMALAGPSGSGKTSLLTVLAGRIPKSAKCRLSGQVLVNGVNFNDAGALRENAFVPQEDLFFSELTVRETLELAAKLHLPREMSKTEKADFVENLISTLGLTSCQHTRVGNAKSRGISGGEKKRLSLGCELIFSPRLIFADEPTTGLDSYQAEKVMQSLQNLAQKGHTVVVSIHQPSGSVFNLCDDLILLSQGSLVYAGSAADATDHFASLGYAVPANTNPAEHYLQLISINGDSEETISESHARIDSLVRAYAEKHPAQKLAAKSAVESSESGSAHSSESSDDGVRVPQLNVFKQLGLLLSRAFKQVTRDKKTNISRFMSSLMSALLFGSIYWRMGLTQTTIQDRLGLLQVCCINSAMSALVKTLYVFGTEREIVARERSRGAYNILPYFSSKLLAELPVSAFFPLIFSAVVYPMTGLQSGAKRIAKFMGLITLESFTSASYGLLVGSLAPSTEAAVAIGPASFVIFIVFGGLYISEADVPSVLSWLPRISIIKHAFEGLCLNEFRGLTFKSKRPWDVRTGEQQLQRLSWGDSSLSKTCVSQLRVLAVNYLLTYLILSLKAPRYQKLEDPVEIEELPSSNSRSSQSMSDKKTKGKSESRPDQSLATA